MSNHNELKLSSFEGILKDEMNDEEFKEDFNKEYLKISLINEIVNLRKSSKMTQAEMAKIVGIPQSNISCFESGKVEPTLDFIQNLVSKLGYKINVSLEKI